MTRDVSDQIATARCRSQTDVLDGRQASYLPAADPTMQPPVLRVAVAGGGIAGCILASQLKKHGRIAVDVFEQHQKNALPAGLNLLLNHNGMATLLNADPSLEAAVRGRGHDVMGWSARTMDGGKLYDLSDVQAEGLADQPGVMARWDERKAETRPVEARKSTRMISREAA